MECYKRRIKNLEIEGDSTIAINTARSMKNPNWRFIYREANIEVDALSRAVSKGFALSWWDGDLNC